MRLEFIIQKPKVDKLRKLLNHFVKFYTKTSLLYMIVETIGETENKVKGSTRFYMTSPFYQSTLCFSNITFMSKFQLKSKEQIIAIPVIDILGLFKYVNDISKNQYEQLEFVLKKNEHQNPERFLQIVQKNQYGSLVNRIEVGQPTFIEDSNYWELQPQSKLNISLKTHVLKKLIAQFCQSKNGMKITINVSQQDGIFGLSAYSNSSIQVEGMEKVKVLKGGVDQFTLECVIVQNNIPNFLTIFQLGAEIEINTTTNNQLVFSCNESESSRSIKFPIMRINQQLN